MRRWSEDGRLASIEKQYAPTFGRLASVNTYNLGSPHHGRNLRESADATMRRWYLAERLPTVGDTADEHPRPRSDTPSVSARTSGSDQDRPGWARLGLGLGLLSPGPTRRWDGT